MNVERRLLQKVWLIILGVFLCNVILLFIQLPQKDMTNNKVNDLRVEVNPVYMVINERWTEDTVDWTEKVIGSELGFMTTLVSKEARVIFSNNQLYSNGDQVHMVEAFYQDQAYEVKNPGAIKLTIPVIKEETVVGFVIFEKVDHGNTPNNQGLLLFLIITLCVQLLMLMGLSLITLFSRNITELKYLEKGLEDIAKGKLKKIRLPKDQRYISISQTYNLLVEELTFLLRQQQSYDGRRKNFLTKISHELKTPIATINAYVEGLTSGVAKDDLTREKYLKVIEVKMQQLMNQVEDFFKYAQEDAGEFKYHLAECYADDVIGSILEQVMAEEHNLIKVENLLPHCIVNIDSVRIEQVITNLFNNAVKHTGQNDQILLRSYREEDEVVIEIVDEGEGINSKDLPYIFDYYYQGQTSKKEDYEGIGLGLAICKEIIDRHEGTMSVRSAMGEGTTMIIRIPVV